MILTLPRAIIDTNTFVSAVLNPSTVPARAIEKALRAGMVLRSLDTWIELEDVLLRKKFDPYQSLTARHQYLEFLFSALEPVSVLTKVSVCRHARDDKFLELAIDGRADLIITGDKDLLVLHPFRGTAIVTPADYLAL